MAMAALLFKWGESMALFKREQRTATSEGNGMLHVEDALLRAMLNDETVDRKMALQVPTIAGGIDIIAGIVASTPIKLYREDGEQTIEIKDDPRVRMLNDDPGDTLNAWEMWNAAVTDYYLEGGGFLYIDKKGTKWKSLRYVEARDVGYIVRGTDPIFRDFYFQVGGVTIPPYKFVRFLRNTRDGIKGTAILEESPLPIATGYQSLLFEKNQLKKGGNKRGFLKSGRGLDEKAMRNLKDAFARLYSNSDSEGVIVLNNGVEFQESSATAVEMQLNELKKSNAEELSKLLHISVEAMSGKASADDIAAIARVVAIPLMRCIECALNRDLLLEREKTDHYWAFDTKELLKGDMLSRYQAYQIAVQGNWMGIDEVRYAEDMPKLGLSWIKLGLQDVLYDPKTKTIYTPNTNQIKKLTATQPPEPEGGTNE